MIKVVKIIITVIALFLFGLVFTAWLKNIKRPYSDSKLSLGTMAENRLYSYGIMEGAGTEVPQTVLPELARLENVTWSQDLQGRRVVNFQFMSLNPMDIIFNVYKIFLEDKGWEVTLSGNTLRGVQKNRLIFYTFNQSNNSVLVTGKYEEVLQ